MQTVFYNEGDIGGYAILQEKLANTVSKMDKILMQHLDPFKIGHAYLRLNPYSMFISLKHICILVILLVRLSLLIKMASWQTYEY